MAIKLIISQKGREGASEEVAGAPRMYPLPSSSSALLLQFLRNHPTGQATNPFMMRLGREELLAFLVTGYVESWMLSLTLKHVF